MYCDPVTMESSEPVYTIMSDRAVLDYYWTYWRDRMLQQDKQDQITEETCILDWATIHWAQEITPGALEQFVEQQVSKSSVA